MYPVLFIKGVIAPDPPLANGSTPVTPVVNGSPVALVKTAAEGVPRAGVTKVGLVARTTAPEPVEVVPPVPPLATAKVPATVIVHELVTGPPEVVKPVVPPDTSTEVTVPVPVSVGLARATAAPAPAPSV